MTHGCLLDYLHEGEGRNLREQELIDITAQVNALSVNIIKEALDYALERFFD